MAQATVTINSKRLERALRVAPQALYRELRNVAGRVGDRYLGHHRAKRMRARVNKRGEISGEGVHGTKIGPSGRPGLRSQFSIRVSGGNLKTLQLKMYTRSYVAKQHEFGETISAKSGKALALPMDAARNSQGRVTPKARRLLKGKQLFVIRRKSGKAFLARYQRAKGGKKLVFWFHLASRARIKPRLGFRKEWRPYRRKVIGEFNRAVGRALKTARMAG